MKLQTKRQLLALGIVVLSITIFSALRPSSAQETVPPQPVKPTLTLTLCVVGEKEACPPEGYKGYQFEEASDCPTLVPENVEDWIAEKPANQFVDVPPTEIKLRTIVLEALDTYLRCNPEMKPASQRKCMVLMFTFKNLQDSAVSIQRITNKEYTQIPPRTWHGRMDSEKRLIYHERADAFFPGYNIKWIIRVGDKKWTLLTGG